MGLWKAFWHYSDICDVDRSKEKDELIKNLDKWQINTIAFERQHFSSVERWFFWVKYTQLEKVGFDLTRPENFQRMQELIGGSLEGLVGFNKSFSGSIGENCSVGDPVLLDDARLYLSYMTSALQSRMQPLISGGVDASNFSSAELCFAGGAPRLEGLLHRLRFLALSDSGKTRLDSIDRIDDPLGRYAFYLTAIYSPVCRQNYPQDVYARQAFSDLTAFRKNLMRQKEIISGEDFLPGQLYDALFDPALFDPGQICPEAFEVFTLDNANFAASLPGYFKEADPCQIQSLIAGYVDEMGSCQERYLIENNVEFAEMYGKKTKVLKALSEICRQKDK